MVSDYLQTRFRFHDFLLDAADRRLTKGETVVHLEPKAFDVLLFLLQNPERLVTKEQIVHGVWSHAYVSDNSLTRCIHQIRGALDDDADHPTYIETVAGSGYRFIARVTTDVQTHTETASETVTDEAGDRYRLAAILVVLVVVGLAIAWFSTRQDDPAIERIAVLPLQNLTGDEGQEYFVQGVHDALIAELSRAVSVDVISRTSVMVFADSELPATEIASQLNVDAFIEGTVLRAGDNLTVTAQLIAVSPERHLWADRYHSDVEDLFAITTDIVADIASEVALEISPASGAATYAQGSVEQEAYEAYLLGRFHLQQRSPDGYRIAQQNYKRAIELDPDFAPPYAGLAHTFGSAAIFGLVSPADGFTEAYRLAKESIRLDNDLAEGHRILAGIEFYWKWNWVEAEIRARRALELDPNAANGYRFLAEILSATGRHDEAFAAIEHARGIDPLPPISQFKPVLILYLQRDFERAIQRARTALEHYPAYWQGHWLLCLSLAATGDTDEAVNSCESAATLSEEASMALGTLGYALALNADHAEALSIAAALEQRSQNSYVGPANIAVIYAATGDIDRAFELLEQGYAVRDQQLVHAHHSALFDTLRSDPRFDRLRLGTISAITGK